MCKYAEFSGKSLQVVFILFSCQSHLVHVITFGLTVNCLETEIQSAKLYPKAQVLSEVDKVPVV